MPKLAKHKVEELVDYNDEEIALMAESWCNSIDLIQIKVIRAIEAEKNQLSKNILAEFIRLQQRHLDLQVAELNQLLEKIEADTTKPTEEKQNLERYKESVKFKRPRTSKDS